MPLVGWALSGDRSAYQYLPESVERYLAPDELASAMSAAGFARTWATAASCLAPSPFTGVWRVK